MTEKPKDRLNSLRMKIILPIRRCPQPLLLRSERGVKGANPGEHPVGIPQSLPSVSPYFQHSTADSSIRFPSRRYLVSWGKLGETGFRANPNFAQTGLGNRFEKGQK
jgi:hypothetical protein